MGRAKTGARAWTTQVHVSSHWAEFGVEGGNLSQIPTRAELERAGDGKVVAWGMWVGTFERKLV